MSDEQSTYLEFVDENDEIISVAKEQTIIDRENGTIIRLKHSVPGAVESNEISREDFDEKLDSLTA